MSRQLIHNNGRLKQARKHLRNSLTPAEAVLWRNLQKSQLNGKKFRRQHSVGRYVLDFYCPERRLTIELDGQGHFTSMASEYDVVRDQFLKSLNIRVLRFENRAVFDNLESVLDMIKSYLS